MRKFILTTIVLTIALAMIGFSEEFEIEDHAVDVYVDGVLMDTYDEDQGIQTPAFLYNGRTMLPLRKVFELFAIYDEQIYWDESDSSVTVYTNEGDVLWIQIDNPILKLNGNDIKTDVPAKLFNSRTFLPLAIISSTLGEVPVWHEKEGFVSMTPNEFSIDEINLSYQLSRKEGYRKFYYDSLLGKYIVYKNYLESREIAGSLKFFVLEEHFTKAIVENAKENYISTKNFTAVADERNIYYWQENDIVYHFIVEFNGKTLRVDTYNITFENIVEWIKTVEEMK